MRLRSAHAEQAMVYGRRSSAIQEGADIGRCVVSGAGEVQEQERGRQSAGAGGAVLSCGLGAAPVDEGHAGGAFE